MTYLCTVCHKQRTQGCFAPKCPGITGHVLTVELPTLPEPDLIMWQHGERIEHYTKLQMQDYARSMVEHTR